MKTALLTTNSNRETGWTSTNHRTPCATQRLWKTFKEQCVNFVISVKHFFLSTLLLLVVYKTIHCMCPTSLFFNDTYIIPTWFMFFQCSDYFGMGKSGCCYSKFSFFFRCNRNHPSSIVLDPIPSKSYIYYFSTVGWTERSLKIHISRWEKLHFQI